MNKQNTTVLWNKWNWPPKFAKKELLGLTGDEEEVNIIVLEII